MDCDRFCTRVTIGNYEALKKNIGIIKYYKDSDWILFEDTLSGWCVCCYQNMEMNKLVHDSRQNGWLAVSKIYDFYDHGDLIIIHSLAWTSEHNSHTTSPSTRWMNCRETIRLVPAEVPVKDSQSTTIRNQPTPFPVQSPFIFNSPILWSLKCVGNHIPTWTKYTRRMEVFKPSYGYVWKWGIPPIIAI